MLAIEHSTPSSEELDQRLVELLSAAEAVDHYLLLNVDLAAADAELHGAYHELMGFLAHMGAVLPAGTDETAEQIARIERVRDAAERAFTVLMDPDRRGVYDRDRRVARSTGSAGGPIHGVMMRAKEEVPGGTMARVLDMRGRQYMSREAFDRAEKVLRRAVEIEPDNAEYSSNYAWCILQNTETPLDEERLARVRRHLEAACAASPWSATCRYRMSQYWRRAGNSTQYRRELEAVLRSDPEHYAASKEMASLRRHERLAERSATELERADASRQGMLASLGRLFRA